MGGAGKSGAVLSGLVSMVYLYVDGTDGREELGCEWLVWKRLGGQGLGCEWLAGFSASGDNRGGGVLGLLCVEQNGVGSILAVH